MNKTKNEQTLKSLSPGDLIKFKRGSSFIGYSHWGIYLGKEKVIHLTGTVTDGLAKSGSGSISACCSGDNLNKAKVCIENFWDIVKDDCAEKNNGKDHQWEPFDPGEIVDRALSQLGDYGYHVLFHNCEHFANWCRYGVEISSQANTVLTVGALGLMVLVVFGLIIAFTKNDQSKTKKKENNEADRKYKHFGTSLMRHH